MTSKLGSRILGIARLAAAFARDWTQARAVRLEVQSLDAAEGGRLCHELSMSSHELDAAMRTPFVSDDLLSPAIVSMGADPAMFEARHRGWSRDMRRVCMMCRHRSRCRRDLTASNFDHRYRSYCPNALSMAEIAESAKLYDRAGSSGLVDSRI